MLDWEVFFARYRPLGVRFARGFVGEGEAAEDVFQDAARAVFEKAAGGAAFASAEHARNYLFRTLRNLAIEVLRRGGRARPSELEGEAEPVDRGPAPFEAAGDEEERRAWQRRRRAVSEAVSALRHAERRALILRYAEGLTYRELAERTGEPLSTLQGRVENALAKLRRRIGKEAGGP